MVEEQVEFSKSISFPKPRNDGNGSTVQMNYSADLKCGFLTVAKQLPDTDVQSARFDYKNKLVSKISEKDMAEMLLVLLGREDSINGEKGLFHQFEKDGVKSTTSIKMKRNDPKYGGYYLSVGKTSPELKNNISVPITASEGIVLEVFLKRSIERIFE